MSILTSTWHELVRRKLLPAAILLLAALVAVPFLLAKDPEPAAPVPAADGAAAPATATAATANPVVTLVQDGERTERRRVLGVRKNPFEPAPVKAVPAESTTVGQATTTPSNAAPVEVDLGDKSTGGSPVPSAGGTPVNIPSTTVPAGGDDQTPAPKRHELYSLVVRFGSSESDTLERMSLARLKPLPDADAPALVYLGVGDDKKSAIFMVDSNVEAQGDGACSPTPENCETIRLREGETEFFDVLDEDGEPTAQYQLDLVKIRRSTTASASNAEAARAKASKAGRRAVRAHQSLSGPLRYRYDAKSGTVRKLEKRAYKALVAKTARVAMGVAGGF